MYSTSRSLAALVVALLPMVGLATLHLGLPVLAPLLMAEAGQPAAAFGWISGAAGLGSVWFYTANHAMTPSLGPVRTLQVGVLVAVAGTLLILTGNWTAMLVGAVLAGFGYATTTPAGSQILADRTPREQWGMLFSLRQAGVPLGGVIAGALGSLIVVAYGWRLALAAILAVAVTTGLALLFVPRSWNDARPRQAFRLAEIFAPANVGRPFALVIRSPALLQIALACAGFAAVQGTTIAFLVTYLNVGLGFELVLAGQLFAIMQASSVVGRIVLGFLADRLGSPRIVLKVLALMSAGSAGLLATVDATWSTSALFTVAAVVGFSIATWNGLYLAEVASLVPPAEVSEATAGTTFFVFLTYMVTPPIQGLVIMTVGYGAAFLFAAVLALAAGVVLMLPVRKPRSAGATISRD